MKNNKMENLELVENKDLREKLIGRLEVLDKVKELILLPNTDFATTKQVADYYVVDTDTINLHYNNFYDEFKNDGVKNLKGKETKEFLATEGISVTNFKGYFMAEGQKFANSKNILFPRRAILRVGMLLRDSEIAKEVRNYLLNLEENSTQEQKEEIIIETIAKENNLLLDIINAEGKLNMAIGLNTYKRYKDTEIKKRDVIIESKEKEIDGLAKGILTWDSKSALNRMIRLIAVKVFKSQGRFCYSEAWKKLRGEMLYKHKISVTKRIENSEKKKATIFDVLDEEELKLAVQSCISLCERYKINTDDIMMEE